jgi:glycine oxidase
LRQALLAAGASLHEQADVSELVIRDHAVQAVRVNGALHPAETVVLCAGAWSPGLAGLPAAARPPVRPVKGQMLALQMPPGSPLLRHVLWTPQVYLVPRTDGRLVVGATVEERGFETHPTAGGVMALLEGAWRAVPAVEDLPLQSIWVGHRPGSRDDAPLLGPAGVEGLILATGHYRNGILLAPVTAALIADCVRHGRLADWAAPFAARRFDREVVRA